MTVSIVTISFNQAQFLERAIRSVLNQHGAEVEYIVVDPGSTDGSRDIIARYGDRISHVLLDPDDGPADGLNRGLAVATGELFGYLNADDMLLPGALERVVGAFRAHPGADVVYGHGFIEDLRRGEVFRMPATRPLSRWRLAHGGAFILQQASFFRTGAVRAAGGFNTLNRSCWDGELVADLLIAGRRFVRLDAELGVFTLHGESISGGGKGQAVFLRDWQAVTEKLGAGRNTKLRSILARLVKWGCDPKALAMRLHSQIDRHQSYPTFPDP
jgi:glycosyltransferase involved in cell wall biosynthesis